ncbi:hypothetical protein CXG81DRAFT_20228 [Caulochytrium protostelioides]|uniref:Uncharacterized protein n=1 Tax=Caulochytrium protostelioides TaxID=1555241 RepID=A0A4P9X3V0_9FUNG|nr:hypothetical protein CXG81DRAFT_20228 [Caulochytrium protostelioides]|eukprot:RKO99712.1 hypothetical protein CXG81DRAFT_20228 [Caulochytrium protostelioides]
MSPRHESEWHVPAHAGRIVPATPPDAGPSARRRRRRPRRAAATARDRRNDRARTSESKQRKQGRERHRRRRRGTSFRGRAPPPCAPVPCRIAPPTPHRAGHGAETCRMERFRAPPLDRAARRSAAADGPRRWAPGAGLPALGSRLNLGGVWRVAAGHPPTTAAAWLGRIGEGPRGRPSFQAAREASTHQRTREPLATADRTPKGRARDGATCSVRLARGEYPRKPPGYSRTLVVSYAEA